MEKATESPKVKRLKKKPLRQQSDILLDSTGKKKKKRKRKSTRLTLSSIYYSEDSKAFAADLPVKQKPTPKETNKDDLTIPGYVKTVADDFEKIIEKEAQSAAVVKRKRTTSWGPLSKSAGSEIITSKNDILHSETENTDLSQSSKKKRKKKKKKKRRKSDIDTSSTNQLCRTLALGELNNDNSSDSKNEDSSDSEHKFKLQLPSSEAVKRKKAKRIRSASSSRSQVINIEEDPNKSDNRSINALVSPSRKRKKDKESKKVKKKKKKKKPIRRRSEPDVNRIKINDMFGKFKLNNVSSFSDIPKSLDNISVRIIQEPDATMGNEEFTCFQFELFDKSGVVANILDVKPLPRTDSTKGSEIWFEVAYSIFDSSKAEAVQVGVRLIHEHENEYSNDVSSLQYSDRSSSTQSIDKLSDKPLLSEKRANSSIFTVFRRKDKEASMLAEAQKRDSYAKSRAKSYNAISVNKIQQGSPRAPKGNASSPRFAFAPTSDKSPRKETFVKNPLFGKSAKKLQDITGDSDLTRTVITQPLSARRNDFIDVHEKYCHNCNYDKSCRIAKTHPSIRIVNPKVVQICVRINLPEHFTDVDTQDSGSECDNKCYQHHCRIKLVLSYGKHLMSLNSAQTEQFFVSMYRRGMKGQFNGCVNYIKSILKSTCPIDIFENVAEIFNKHTIKSSKQEVEEEQEVESVPKPQLTNELFDCELRLLLQPYILSLSKKQLKKLLNKSAHLCGTILHYLAAEGLASMMSLLLDAWQLLKGSKEIVNIIDINGKTPLHFAAIAHQRVCADVLLVRGANARAVDYERRTPAQYARLHVESGGVYEILVKSPNATITAELERTKAKLAQKEKQLFEALATNTVLTATQPIMTSTKETVVHQGRARSRSGGSIGDLVQMINSNLQPEQQIKNAEFAEETEIINASKPLQSHIECVPTITVEAVQQEDQKHMLEVQRLRERLKSFQAKNKELRDLLNKEVQNKRRSARALSVALDYSKACINESNLDVVDKSAAQGIKSNVDNEKEMYSITKNSLTWLQAAIKVLSVESNAIDADFKQIGGANNVFEGPLGKKQLPIKKMRSRSTLSTSTTKGPSPLGKNSVNSNQLQLHSAPAFTKAPVPESTLNVNTTTPINNSSSLPNLAMPMGNFPELPLTPPVGKRERFQKSMVPRRSLAAGTLESQLTKFNMIHKNSDEEEDEEEEVEAEDAAKLRRSASDPALPTWERFSACTYFNDYEDLEENASITLQKLEEEEEKEETEQQNLANIAAENNAPTKEIGVEFEVTATPHGTPKATRSIPQTLAIPQQVLKRLTTELREDYLRLSADIITSLTASNASYDDDFDDDYTLTYARENGAEQVELCSVCIITEFLISTNTDMVVLDTFLMVFREYITPATFFKQLQARWQTAIPTSFTKEATIAHRGIIFTIYRWLSLYKQDFQDPELRKLFNSFLERELCSASRNFEGTEFEAISADFYYSWAQKLKELSILPIVPAIKKELVIPKTEQRLELLHLHPTEAAMQLTLLEFELFAQVNVLKMLHPSKLSSTCPAANDLISRFNTMSTWVATEVVLTPNLKQRSAVIRHFIHIADECAKINNFNTLLEILAGLGMACVSRLKKTWKGVPHKSKAKYKKLDLLMETRYNFKRYRAQLKAAKLPILPYFGIFMRDITFALTGKEKSEDIVDFSMWASVKTIIDQVRLYQQYSYNFKEVKQLKNYFQNLVTLNEDTLHAHSVKLEAFNEV